MGADVIVFDLETNGLLNDATRIHCISLYSSETKKIDSFNDERYADNPKDLPMAGHYSITTALSWLEGADYLVGHNIINFDIPVIKKFYNWHPSKSIKQIINDIYVWLNKEKVVLKYFK